MHAFTAPPPPLRYPPVVPTLPNEATGVIAAAWTKPSVNAYPLKYTNGLFALHFDQVDCFFKCFYRLLGALKGEHLKCEQIDNLCC